MQWKLVICKLELIERIKSEHEIPPFMFVSRHGHNFVWLNIEYTIQLSNTRLIDLVIWCDIVAPPTWNTKQKQARPLNNRHYYYLTRPFQLNN